ncbi:hypothetical protein [Microbacterium sp. NPDC096154]|uniref:hypothetical protein n=1 Tax=Microbacterium sp. NPDC096154 TaxID=3155549 RepID=UPI003334312D
MNTIHQLELVPLTEGAWRVCDRSVATCDAASVIAYVEQLPTDESEEPSYEAVWVFGTRGITHHTTIESVLSMAASLRAAAASSGAAKPKPIAHFPPGGKRPLTPLAG